MKLRSVKRKSDSGTRGKEEAAREAEQVKRGLELSGDFMAMLRDRHDIRTTARAWDDRTVRDILSCERIAECSDDDAAFDEVRENVTFNHPFDDLQSEFFPHTELAEAFNLLKRSFALDWWTQKKHAPARQGLSGHATPGAAQTPPAGNGNKAPRRGGRPPEINANDADVKKVREMLEAGKAPSLIKRKTGIPERRIRSIREKFHVTRRAGENSE